MRVLWGIDRGRIEPFALALITTGVPLAEAAAVWQVIWLVAVVVRLAYRG